MFDINDMAKMAFEPVLSIPLQRAQKDGYINITGGEGKKKIEYITSEKHVEHGLSKINCTMLKILTLPILYLRQFAKR